MIFTETQNELYNENCQKFIDKYGVLKKQDNSIIEGLSNLIYAQTYNELPESMKQHMPCPNLDYIDLIRIKVFIRRHFLILHLKKLKNKLK